MSVEFEEHYPDWAWINPERDETLPGRLVCFLIEEYPDESEWILGTYADYSWVEDILPRLVKYVKSLERLPDGLLDEMVEVMSKDETWRRFDFFQTLVSLGLELPPQIKVLLTKEAG